MSATIETGVAARTLRWSPVRVANGSVLALWAGLFWFLLASHRWSLYLSSRTAWLVPMGAMLLSAGAIGRIASARVARPEQLRRREAWTLGAIALPVVLILSLPPTTLGTYAVGRRSAFVGSGVTAATPGLATGGPITLIDVAAAQSSKDALALLQKRAGDQVDFEGLVTKDASTPAGEFLLTRFIITCCVADATIAQVRIVDVPPGNFSDNDWVKVVGRIYPLGSDILVDAASVAKEPMPTDPYLTP